MTTRRTRRTRTREQKLIDILFQCVATATDERAGRWFQGKPIEQRMEWVVNQLEQCGFPTVPCGGSWGVLIEKKK